MLTYRIGHKNFATRLEASGVSGRWTSGGKMVIYCAESIPVAFLENMVRRQGVGFNADFKIVVIEIPDALPVKEITVAQLAKGWRQFSDYSLCQPIGNQWYDTQETPILKVPSAVLPSACNYVINTAHKDFSKISILTISDLEPDERIEAILKRHKV